ncbi:hypothetical protein ACIQRS_00925 [Streptomyces termitum]|nr:hypothetical protein [Streptomyces termitum]
MSTDRSADRSTDRSTAYFAELAAALAAAGVPAAEAGATVEDLRAHLAETGGTPEEEFGPAAGFAARLGGLAPEAAGPEEEVEHWTWTADLFNDRRMLAVHGDQGWEVESLDPLGRFVCRRTPGSALRWEYRREVLTGGHRERVLAALEPEGWELCGEWLVYGYLKRPYAATAGPGGTVTAPPAAPDRWLYLSRPGKAVLAGWAVLVTVLLAVFLADGIGASGLAVTIAIASALSAVWTAQLETTTGRAHRGPDPEA